MEHLFEQSDFDSEHFYAAGASAGAADNDNDFLQVMFDDLSQETFHDYGCGDHETYKTCENDANASAGASGVTGSLVDGNSSSLSNVTAQRGKSCAISLSSMEPIYNSLGINRIKVFSKWGLNFHPSDYNGAMILRGKFLEKVRERTYALFYDILGGKINLSSGKSFRSSPWGVISDELYSIVASSVKSMVMDSCTELDNFLSEARVIDTDVGDVDCGYVRAITDHEKGDAIDRHVENFYKGLRLSIKDVWSILIKRISRNTDAEDDCGTLQKGVLYGGLKINLRLSDNYDISYVKSTFLSKIARTIYDKFRSMLNNNHRFEDGDVLCKFSWMRVYRKLFPVAEEEVRPIFEDEEKEIKKVLSGALVVLDSGDYRKLTCLEERVILKSIMNNVAKLLRSICKKIWKSIVSCPSDDSDFGGCMGSVRVRYKGEDIISGCDVSLPKLSLYYEDERLVLNLRRVFAREVRVCIWNKFFEMLKCGYTFDDHTVIDRSPWRKMSKKLLPIAKEEVRPIIERERAKINEILLESRVVISVVSDRSSATRLLSFSERVKVLERIMKSVNKKATDTFARVWVSLINMPEEKFLGK
ncbi:hypothetical protein [Candidatus Ichthyocystis hellenicum]|uniref:hypothetical protein n=1 Tax=Candidatus Ichthyocystis hellenicum TaxID=1561003 RepID=UPI000B8A374C|nr:hypothetical protein [Candidatus Ichthyocystis hellenicum]